MPTSLLKFALVALCSAPAILLTATVSAQPPERPAPEPPAVREVVRDVVRDIVRDAIDPDRPGPDRPGRPGPDRPDFDRPGPNPHRDPPGPPVPGERGPRPTARPELPPPPPRFLRELPRFKPNSVSLYLSPSNQIRNIGFGPYRSEMERMNEVADVVEPILRAHGVVVYRNDPKKGLRDYVAEANNLDVDLYFAIHSNAANQRARGTEAFCFRFGGEGERFAKRVVDEILTIYDGPNRGVKESHSHFGPGKPLYETANPNAPAVLVEIAFHDEERDATWILANIEPIGHALARAVLKHLAAEHPEAVVR